MKNTIIRRGFHLGLAAAFIGGLTIAASTLPANAFSVKGVNTEVGEGPEGKGDKEGRGDHDDCAKMKHCEKE